MPKDHITTKLKVLSTSFLSLLIHYLAIDRKLEPMLMPNTLEITSQRFLFCYKALKEEVMN
jgi:hypothetical protein